MDNTESLHILHTTVHCYLSTLLSVADCLANACPPVGGPYKTKLSRLEARLAFDTSVEAVEESAITAAAELKDYSVKAAAYLESHAAGFRRTLVGLEEALQSLTQREEFYCGRLRQFASQMESATYPSDPEHLADVVAMQSAGLLHSIESMSFELQSLAERLRAELRTAEKMVTETETTDPATGLTNRREMERRIAERRDAGLPYALILFTLTEDASPEILRQVSARLTQQFRYSDRVGRWGQREFLVLFAGAPNIAEIRVAQIVPWISGRYPLDNGEQIEVDVESHVMSDAIVSA